MKKRLAGFLCALALVTAFPTALASEIDTPISPWDYQALLGQGMDVDWSKTGQGRDAYNAQTAADFRAAGVDHVRIRVKDDADEALLVQLDRQIADCLANGILPVVAYQADEMKNDPSRKNIEKTAAWWRTVAERYQNVSHRLAFDLLIEATDALNDQPDTLNAIYEELDSAIRGTNPDRILMISPRLRSDAAYLTELEIPTAHNGYLMAEWHFYAAGPARDNPRKQWTTGTEAERALALEKIALAVRWQTQTGIPTWVGAWMPGNYNDGDDYTVEEQMAFASFLADALSLAGIPFAVNSDTHFYDRIEKCWIGELEPVRTCIYGPAFTDAGPDHWCRASIEIVCRRGLFQGTSDTAFSPDGTMSREMLWTVLARLAGTRPANFDAGRQWAVETGVSDGSDPKGPVTRQQLATLLYRCAGNMGRDVSASASLNRFQDGGMVAVHGRAPMEWAVAEDLLQGRDGFLRPRETATRAQTAAVLARFLAS